MRKTSELAINGKKTQLLVISPPNGCDMSATIATRQGHTIDSVDRMKAGGIHLWILAGSWDPCGVNWGEVKKWMLYYLRDAGFEGEPLYKLY